jgi:hypothetical protein
LPSHDQVRVHNVLKQQKTKSGEESNLEEVKSDMERTQKAVDTLRAKCQELTDKLQIATDEKDTLQVSINSI